MENFRDEKKKKMMKTTSQASKPGDDLISSFDWEKWKVGRMKTTKPTFQMQSFRLDLTTGARWVGVLGDQKRPGAGFHVKSAGCI